MKDNSSEATLRKTTKPRAEAVVREAKEAKGAHAKAVLQQNRNDQNDSSLTVIPNSKRIPNPPNTHGK